jgi:hypothetical protein
VGKGGVSRTGDEIFDGCEWSSYIIAEANFQINARDVSVRSSGPGEMQIDFLISRDYPFLGAHPQCRISPPLLFS